MKNYLFTLLFSTVAVISNAQELQTTELKQGTIIAEKEVVIQGNSNESAIAHELTHVVQQGGKPRTYIIREDNTGITYESLPIQAHFAPGVQIVFLTNANKSKHDAAMAAIQNTR